MHYYAFGSICRGEITVNSDFDILAITDGVNSNLNASKLSIYSYGRIRSLWSEGNPFAWHLFLEARLLYADDGLDFIASLGEPCIYGRRNADCIKFRNVFIAACGSIQSDPESSIFDLSTIFLAIRNIATCFSFSRDGSPVFSRHSARRLGCYSLDIDFVAYRALERARLLSTRGEGSMLSDLDIAAALKSLPYVRKWMDILVKESRDVE